METVALNIEQEFISHLADKAALEFILREGVSVDLLLGAQTKTIYEFVQKHFNDTGHAPTKRVLESEFPSAEFEVPETTPHYVVDKLRDRYQRNEVGRVIEDVAVVAQSDPKEAMNILRDKVFEIERTSLSQRHVWTQGDHKMFIHNIQQRIVAGMYKGVSIGFPDIDTYTGGVKNGNLAYILARMKRQKTFMTLNAFIAQTVVDEAPYFQTLENTEEEIMLRISCMISGVPWDNAQKGALMPADWKLIDKAWDTFSQHKFWIEMPPMDERTVNHFTMKADKVGAGPLLISQFKYIKGTKGYYQPNEEPAEVAVDLKRAAVRPDHERPIIVEAQFNRGGDTMEELEDFDGSKVGLTDMIPQAADTLYGIFQNKDMRANHTLEFGILEARNHGKAAWNIETQYVTKTSIKLLPGSQH